MTARRFRDLKRLIEPLVAEHGAEFRTVDVDGHHTKILFTKGDRRFAVWLSFEPSDWRSRHNVKALIQRKLKEHAHGYEAVRRHTVSESRRLPGQAAATIQDR